MQAESFAEFSRDSLCENCILKLGEYASSHLFLVVSPLRLCIKQSKCECGTNVTVPLETLVYMRVMLRSLLTLAFYHSRVIRL